MRRKFYYVTLIVNAEEDSEEDILGNLEGLDFDDLKDLLVSIEEK